MKKWIKRHWRPLVVGICLLPIGNSSYGIMLAIKSGKDLYFIIHVVCLFTFLVMILWLSGIAGKIYTWWERD